MTQPNIAISVERPDSVDAVQLIRQLDEEILVRYPEMPRHLIHGLHPADLADPNFRFIVARADGNAIGCGALRQIEPDAGEVKRMFVVGSFRRRGIARGILAAVEAEARSLGYEYLRLETGKAQPEAVNLYQSAGYRQIDGFGEYVGSPFSVCFEKAMRPASRLAIRRATPADEDTIVALWRTCAVTHPNTNPHKEIARSQEFRSSRLLVGEIDGRLVSTVMVGYEGRRGWVNYLAVDPTLQRQGIGRAMMAVAEEWLLELGCPKINLQVRESNTKVLAFYARLGYSDDKVVSLGKRILSD